MLVVWGVREARSACRSLKEVSATWVTSRRVIPQTLQATRRLLCAHAELLKVGERFALCTIVRLAGSGPRRAGAKMLVLDGGESVGTVGGGVLEVKTAQWAHETLQGGRPLCRSFALDLQQASDEGMTCGGEVEVLIEPFDGMTPAARDFFARSRLY